MKASFHQRETMLFTQWADSAQNLLPKGFNICPPSPSALELHTLSPHPSGNHPNPFPPTLIRTFSSLKFAAESAGAGAPERQDSEPLATLAYLCFFRVLRDTS